jgi:hypothetical protein
MQAYRAAVLLLTNRLFLLADTVLERVTRISANCIFKVSSEAYGVSTDDHHHICRQPPHFHVPKLVTLPPVFYQRPSTTHTHDWSAGCADRSEGQGGLHHGPRILE